MAVRPTDSDAGLVVRAIRSLRDASLWAELDGPLRSIVRPVLRLLRSGAVRFGDPAAPFPVGPFQIDLPLSHELPRYRAAHPLYDTALGRLARAVWAARPGSAIIDIGANVGDTAAIIRSECPAPLLCIEGSSAFLPLLRRNAARLGPDVYVEQALIGPRRATIRARVTAGLGTAAVEQDATGPVVEIETLDDVLRRHPDLPKPGLVKIDTDGWDCPIVEASLGVWERDRPVLFFEYDPDFYPEWDPRPMFAGLLALGYERALVYENVGEFAGSVPLSDAMLVEELHARYQGWAHQRYADLCLFHRDDRDVGDAFRRSEIRIARRSPAR